MSIAHEIYRPLEAWHVHRFHRLLQTRTDMRIVEIAKVNCPDNEATRAIKNSKARHPLFELAGVEKGKTFERALRYRRGLLHREPRAL